MHLIRVLAATCILPLSFRSSFQSRWKTSGSLCQSCVWMRCWVRFDAFHPLLGIRQPPPCPTMPSTRLHLCHCPRLSHQVLMLGWVSMPAERISKAKRQHCNVISANSSLMSLQLCVCKPYRTISDPLKKHLIVVIAVLKILCSLDRY